MEPTTTKPQPVLFGSRLAGALLNLDPAWQILDAATVNAAREPLQRDSAICGGARRGETEFVVAIVGVTFDPEYLRSTYGAERKVKHTQVAAPAGYQYAAEFVDAERVEYALVDNYREDPHTVWVDFRLPHAPKAAELAELRALVASFVRQWNWPEIDYPGQNPILLYQPGARALM